MRMRKTEDGSERLQDGRWTFVKLHPGTTRWVNHVNDQ